MQCLAAVVERPAPTGKSKDDPANAPDDTNCANYDSRSRETVTALSRLLDLILRDHTKYHCDDSRDEANPTTQEADQPDHEGRNRETVITLRSTAGD